MPDAKQTAKKDSQTGEQGMLLDVGPKQSKEITKVAKSYRGAVVRRMAALEEEKALKAQLLGMVKHEKLKPMDDGSIQFHVDGIFIKVTPRDELIQVREDDQE